MPASRREHVAPGRRQAAGLLDVRFRLPTAADLDEVASGSASTTRTAGAPTPCCAAASSPRQRATATTVVARPPTPGGGGRLHRDGRARPAGRAGARPVLLRAAAPRWPCCSTRARYLLQELDVRAAQPSRATSTRSRCTTTGASATSCALPPERRAALPRPAGGEPAGHRRCGVRRPVSDFLVNLARRSAGLVPVARARTAPRTRRGRRGRKAFGGPGGGAREAGRGARRPGAASARASPASWASPRPDPEARRPRGGRDGAPAGHDSGAGHRAAPEARAAPGGLAAGGGGGGAAGGDARTVRPRPRAHDEAGAHADPRRAPAAPAAAARRAADAAPPTSRLPGAPAARSAASAGARRADRPRTCVSSRAARRRRVAIRATRPAATATAPRDTGPDGSCLGPASSR